MTVQTDHNMEAPPHQQLGDYQAWALDLGPSAPVDMIWVSKARKASPLPHLLMPHGEPSIAVRRRRDQFDAFDEIDLVVCGPVDRAQWYCPDPAEELIAVRLKPEISVAAFGIHAGDFLNADPVARTTAAKSFCQQTIRIAETGDRIEIAQALLNDLISHHREIANHGAAETAAAFMLRESNGRMPIHAIAKELEISERHLRRRFQDAMGMSPKAYGRQLRVAAAAIRADEEASPDWATIAYEVGYFDQAHMITDFRSLCGQTPVEIHQARQALSSNEWRLAG